MLLFEEGGKKEPGEKLSQQVWKFISHTIYKNT